MMHFDSPENGTYFFNRLAEHFGVPATADYGLNEQSIMSFFLVLSAKNWEASTVEGGRKFDRIMTHTVRDFLLRAEDKSPRISSPPPIMIIPTPLTSPITHPEIIARSIIELVKSSLGTLYVPPTEWNAGTTMPAAQHTVGSIQTLERCTAFMEPSTVLMVLKSMLSKPGTIPDLKGNSDGRFDYAIEKVRIKSFDLSRGICIIKPASSSTISTSGFSPLVTRADLVINIKEVNLQLDHEWTIDWNHQRYGSYKGTNTVTVRGLTGQVFLSLFPDDQGPVVTKATINLGSVEHSCKISNASMVSGILAQAALDWFAEPLTRLMQSGSQSAIEKIVQDMNLSFRVNVWNCIVMTTLPTCALEGFVSLIRDHLPAHGVNI